MYHKYTELGIYLKRRRKLLGLTQAQVAELSGRAQAHIARLESGRADPTFSTSTQVLRALGAELVPVPIRLLPAVRYLLAEAEGVNIPARSRLVGNEPEDADAS